MIIFDEPQEQLISLNSNFKQEEERKARNAQSGQKWYLMQDEKGIKSTGDDT